ncbi:MAG: hypothetical protein R3C28_26555 [Pirellulaceae bacterium]
MPLVVVEALNGETQTVFRLKFWRTGKWVVNSCRPVFFFKRRENLGLVGGWESKLFYHNIKEGQLVSAGIPMRSRFGQFRNLSISVWHSTSIFMADLFGNGGSYGRQRETALRCQAKPAGQKLTIAIDWFCDFVCVLQPALAKHPTEVIIRDAKFMKTSNIRGKFPLIPRQINCIQPSLKQIR